MAERSAILKERRKGKEERFQSVGVAAGAAPGGQKKHEDSPWQAKDKAKARAKPQG